MSTTAALTNRMSENSVLDRFMRHRLAVVIPAILLVLILEKNG